MALAYQLLQVATAWSLWLLLTEKTKHNFLKSRLQPTEKNLSGNSNKIPECEKSQNLVILCLT